jgi:hypothetical protein
MSNDRQAPPHVQHFLPAGDVLILDISQSGIKDFRKARGLLAGGQKCPTCIQPLLGVINAHK